MKVQGLRMPGEQLKCRSTIEQNETNAIILKVSCQLTCA